MGLRERKKRETRIALSWAAIRLTVDRGFDDVKVEDIAAEAGVSPRTFNNYFAGKAEAIAARHFERAARIADELRARPSDEPLWEAIRAAALIGAPLVTESADTQPDAGWVAGLRLLTGHPALRGEFLKAGMAAERELAAAVAERTGADPERDLYPRLVAGTVGVAISASTDLWLRVGPPASYGELLQDALDQVTRGLPLPTGPAPGRSG
ncbi:TetR family transcriptional regulator [Nonomuraea sp. SMC257]|uniref:TetR family transcriptional regulator n=1 Tax=Nonomuraea montanisoli TaxID=2741721 RepID=A0A7Y6I6L0_9ACTN|nr:TetR family transcriptional regulator [Nonomuraea montanisoli]NUW32640.1 TetR family transcriptional regulator [Nonomuraea montanisoli]